MNRNKLRLLRMPNNQLLAFCQDDERALDLIFRLRRSPRLTTRVGLRLLVSRAATSVDVKNEETKADCEDLLGAASGLLGEEIGSFALHITPDSSRATIVFLDGAGQTAFVKARSENGVVISDLAQLMREYRPLCPATVVMPEALASGTVGRWTMVALTDVGGSNEDARPRPLKELVPYLTAMRSATAAERTAAQALDLIGTITDRLPTETVRLVQLLRNRWTADTVVTSLAHGDFVPWNMCLERDGRLHLWDWDKAVRNAPWPYDAIHYSLLTRRFLQNQDRREALPGVVEDLGRCASELGIASTENDLLLRVAAYAACRSADEHRRSRVTADGEWLVEALTQRLQAE